MWSLIENVLCVLEMHVFYALVGPCDLYMPVQLALKSRTIPVPLFLSSFPLMFASFF